MRYYIDFEFLDHFKLGWNLRYYHTIEMIQVGIKAEDGRTYTAINRNFNPKKANPWVRENVLHKIVINYVKSRFGEERNKLIQRLDNKTINRQFRIVQRLVGKSQKQICAEIFDFINPDLGFHCSAYNNSEFRDENSQISKHFKKHNVIHVNDHFYAKPTFVGYFSAYDHVLLASMFGTMAQLPPGFPMYTIDLKQKLDEAIIKKYLGGIENHPEFDNVLNLIKEQNDFPKQVDEHDALADAEWNEKLDLFIQRITK